MTAEHAEETDGRRLRGARRRSELVEATVRVVARDGITGVTHRAVAAEAGVPKSAATYHFSSLDDLLIAALGGAIEQLIAALSDVPAGSDTDLLAAALVDVFAQKHRERVVAGYELYLLAARRPALRPAVDLWLTVFADLIGRRHTTDRVRVRLCLAAVDGYFLQCLSAGVDPDSDDLAALLRTALS